MTCPDQALRQLLDVCERMDLENEAQRPTEEEYQAALTGARTALEERPESQAAHDVLSERRRQIDHEGWSTDHDDNEHNNGELAAAAACYLNPMFSRDPRIIEPLGWPWGHVAWKPGSQPSMGHGPHPHLRKSGRAPDRRRDLVRAAALILAEIERLDRQHAAWEAKK